MISNNKPQSEQAQDQNLQKTNEQIRINLGNAFAFVEGAKSIQSFSAFTFEEACDKFIERVEGKGTTTRPNAIDRITRVMNDVAATIARVKALPPEAFRRVDQSNDVNTPEVPMEEY